MKYFVFGDVHGFYSLFIEELKIDGLMKIMKKICSLV